MNLNAVHIPENLRHRFIHLGRRGDRGVAQAVIKYILWPHHLGLLQACLLYTSEQKIRRMTVDTQGETYPEPNKLPDPYGRS